MPYTPPQRNLPAFTCPLCNTYAKQEWSEAVAIKSIYYTKSTIKEVAFAFCSYCDSYTLWHKEKMLFPISGNAPIPHEEMQRDIREIYEEARNIVSLSAKSAAALLRLSIEKLTNDILGDKKGKDLFANIGILVKQGLPEQIQKQLDILRVTGNHAVHPVKSIDFDDTYETAISLFDLLNSIVDELVARPKRLDKLYKRNISKKELDSIKSRDKKIRTTG